MTGRDARGRWRTRRRSRTPPSPRKSLCTLRGASSIAPSVTDSSVSSLEGSFATPATGDSDRSGSGSCDFYGEGQGFYTEDLEDSWVRGFGGS